MADDVEVRPLEAPQVPDGTAVPDAPGQDPSQATGPINPAQFIRDAQGNLGYWQQQGVQTMGAMQAAQQRMIKDQEAAVKARQPMYDQLQQEMSRPALTPEQQADMMKPAQMPQVPDKPAVDPQEFKSFFGMAMIMTAVLGRFMGADMNQGITALAQAMTGFKTGATEKANQQMAIYKEKFEAAMNAQREKLLRYKQIIDARNSSIQDKMNLLKIEAARSDDQQALFALQQNNYKMLLDYINKQETQWRQMVKSGVEMYDKAMQESGRMARAEMKDEQASQKLEQAERFKQMNYNLSKQRVEIAKDAKVNDYLKFYEQEFHRITQEMIGALQKYTRTAGGNQQALDANIEVAAYAAAQKMAQLNKLMDSVEVDGQKIIFTNPADRAKAETLEYWVNVAHAFKSQRSDTGVKSGLTMPPPVGSDGSRAGGQPAQPAEDAIGGQPPQAPAVPADGVQWDQ